jgi:hypothetical protein
MVYAISMFHEAHKAMGSQKKQTKMAENIKIYVINSSHQLP